MATTNISYRHVTIIHGNDGTQWCKYIAKTFQGPGVDISIHTVNANNLKYRNPPEMEASIRESYAVFLLVTADFITYMETNSDWLSVMLEKRDIELTSVVAATLSIDDDDYNEVCTNNNYKHSTWNFHKIHDNVKDIVKNVLEIIDINITSHETRIEREEEKQIQQHQQQHHPTEPSQQSSVCQLIPNKVKMSQDNIAVIFFEEIKGEVSLEFEGVSGLIIATTANPYCATFVPPVLPSGTYPVTVRVNGSVKEILQIQYCNFEFTSLELMKKYFDVFTTDGLDSILASQCRQSLCSDDILNRLVELTNYERDADKNTDSTYPTVLHWAAALGLHELTSQLLIVPCATELCKIRNCNGDSVADLAGHGGHQSLQVYIEDFVNTKDCVDVCDLYVQACGSSDIYESTIITATEDTYIDMTQHQNSQECIYSNTQPDGGLTSNDTQDDIYEVLPQETDILPERYPKNSFRNRFRSVPETDQDFKDLRRRGLPSAQGFLQQTIEEKLSDGAVGCKSQNELITIQNDFKAGNFTLEEAEMLFRGWKTRNEQGNAVSFKEKQKSLNEMRQKYKTTLSLLTKAKLSSLQESEELNLPSDISLPVMRTKALTLQANPRRTSEKPEITPRGKSCGSFRASNDSGCCVDFRQNSSLIDQSNHRNSLLNKWEATDCEETRYQQPQAPSCTPRQKTKVYKKVKK